LEHAIALRHTAARMNLMYDFMAKDFGN